ncbi:MAG: PEP-CTERM sorting domain-containing protein [Okeania sp. SIO3B5]|uniref:PEP-CTERM sorting domain-containing protein n=1 Tax=Okeania sp. SIO3B5 TaxID=2607811 RepID=UPI0013FEA429|nr:PEP-CTERM sorting domain-containing protein [Okeania sp. SIO3B5]NEO55726.1 PEP-CTERM sorting domain-containing protein [Okeania sp. SIO3B5]
MNIFKSSRLLSRSLIGAIGLSASAMALLGYVEKAYSGEFCPPGSHWIETCLSGTNFIRGESQLGIDINLDGIADLDGVFSSDNAINVINVRSDPLDDSINFPGLRPVDGHNGVIDLEMISMNSTGEVGTFTEGWTLLVGRNNGLTPTLGAAAECETAATDCGESFEDSSKAYSFFNMFLEISGTPFGTLHNKDPFEIASITDSAPPSLDITFKPLNSTTALFDENDIHVANLTSILTTGVSASSKHRQCQVNISQFAIIAELEPQELVCQTVPEPSATIPLILVGLTGVWGLRKK